MTSSPRFSLHRVRLIAPGLLLAALPSAVLAPATLTAEPPRICREAVLRAELTAGQNFAHPLSKDLRIWFQSVNSGWIIRVVPSSGPLPAHDYAEVATPPYNSVTPLSLSTDFSFRAQDAIGWNPRRFRFAASSAQYQSLLSLYNQISGGGSTLLALTENKLSEQLALAPEAKLTVIDSRLIPGMTNQWRTAAAVSSAFESTAHTFAAAPDGKPSDLGKLLWISFKLEFDLPPGFVPAQDLAIVPYPCGSL